TPIYSDEWDLTLADGSTISMSLAYDGGVNHIDVTVHLASAYAGIGSDVGGICGPYTGAPVAPAKAYLISSDNRSFDPTSATDVEAFAQTWRVPDDKSMFTNDVTSALKMMTSFPVSVLNPLVGKKSPSYKTVCSTPKTTTTTTQAAQKTETATCTLEPYKPTYPAVLPTTTTRYATSTAAAAPTKTPTADEIADATAHCSEILKCGCEGILQDVYSNAINFCVSDIVGTGSYLFCEGHKRSYNALCRKIVDQLVISPNATVAATAASIAEDAGHNDATCANNCSGPSNGVCATSGCKCIAPFTGADCSIDQSKLNPTPGPYSAPIVITPQ
ncbi:hypothetical protein HK101_006923, partial [Irineochytrium annulatum]